MDLQLIRLVVGKRGSVYVSDNATHNLLYERLLRNINYTPNIFKLRNNYHLGIL